MIYPWQIKEWQQLWQLKQNNRLPHALLFIGIPGIGKAHFADHFTRALFCQQQGLDGNVCNSCHSCRLIAGHTHPNVLWIEPEKSGHPIKIDQIRESIDFVNQSSLQGEYRVLLINPANSMNRNAANALLKTLEEPSAGALIILLSDQSESLPATILSRCQRFTFPQPQKEPALTWLKSQCDDSKFDFDLMLDLANGAPLTALQFIQNDVLAIRENLFQTLYLLKQKQADPLKSAANLQDVDVIQMLDFIISWIIDLLRLQLGGETITNRDYQKQLTELTQQTRVSQMTQFMDYLQQLRQQLKAGINLNKQLMLEDVFIRWMA